MKYITRFPLTLSVVLVGYVLNSASIAYGDVNTECVRAAVAVRENAIQTATADYGADWSAILLIRADDLSEAWQIAEKKTRRTAIRAAWNVYRANLELAKATLKAARQVAWGVFRNEIQTNCQVPKNEISLRAEPREDRERL